MIAPLARAVPALRPAAATLIALLVGACAAPASRPPDRGTAPPAVKPGGYYLDDGPHADPPDNLDSVPDAQPRAEPIRAANTRPYTVMGRTYTPLRALTPFSETGVASWYGKRYHGQPTASGEIYDMFAMTAAHPTLPIPSYARVSRADGSRAVVVRINDRGPFHSERIIDLSYTAAHRLGILGNGSALVRVESILPGVQEADAAPAPPPAPAPAAAATPASAVPGVAQSPGIYLQLGAFSVADNAESFLRRMRAELPALDGLATVVPGAGLYRVQAGPYMDRAQALQAADRIERLLDLKPILLTR